MFFVGTSDCALKGMQFHLGEKNEIKRKQKQSEWKKRKKKRFTKMSDSVKGKIIRY